MTEPQGKSELGANNSVGFASSSVYIPQDLAPVDPQGASIVRWSPLFIKQSGASLTVCEFHLNRESGPSKGGNSSPYYHGYALSLATGLWLKSLYTRKCMHTLTSTYRHTHVHTHIGTPTTMHIHAQLIL